MKRYLYFLFLLLFFLPVLALGKIDINSAELSELDKIDGVGPVYAQRIIDNRPYSLLDDLLKVKGIGEKTLQKIKEQGLACVNCYNEDESEIIGEDEKNIIIKTKPELEIKQEKEVVYPINIFINEILPNPEGPDETNEWIELYNKNNFDVDLYGWKLKDIDGSITTFIIPENTKILTNNFLVFKRPQTKISLNNSQDGVILLNPKNEIIDNVSFEKSPLNQSYNRIDNNWSWSQELTPLSKNIITQSLSKNNLSKTENSDKNIIEQNNLLSSIYNSQNTIQSENIKNNPWFLFIIVLIVAVFLALLILVLKLKYL